MSFRSVISLFVLGFSCTLAGAVLAEAAPRVECMSRYQLGTVSAYEKSTDPTDYRVYDTVAGARLFVYAQPGLTGEWLHYQLSQRARMRVDSACPLDVAGVRIMVQSGGPGFWVTLSSGERNAAQEILRRAKLLVRR